MARATPGKFMTYFYLSVGWLSFALGFIGIFIPILPTTPFMILAAACFSRGSPRFHLWLLQHKIFGPPIVDWQRNRIIRLKFKIVSGLMMSGSCVIIFLSPRIPELVKASVIVFILGMMGFVFTRRSK